MPVGGGGKPAGGYRAGKKGSYGCAGFPTVSADGTVHGCHPTKARAQAQARAIWASTARKSISSVEKSMVKEGDFVMYMGEDDEIMVGRIEYVMTNPGLLGLPGSEYALEYMEDDKPVIVRKYEQEDGVWEEEEYVCYHRMSEVVKIESLPVSVDLVVEMGSNGSGIPEPTEEVQMAMYDAQMGKSQMANAPYEDAEEMDKEYQGCGCPTCKELNVDCPNCPVCQVDMNKAKKPNYEDMIQPRRGGSTPSNPRLYEAVVREAKDKFDVYPSAVANGWVVQEYKRRGGTYKGEDMDKRDYSMDARRTMAESGMAMPDGSFPIANGADLQNAIQSVGRASNYAAAKEHIIRRARALGMMEMLPQDWRNNATKGMGNWSGSIFDLNPFVK